MLLAWWMWLYSFFFLFSFLLYNYVWLCKWYNTWLKIEGSWICYMTSVDKGPQALLKNMGKGDNPNGKNSFPFSHFLPFKMASQKTFERINVYWKTNLWKIYSYILPRILDPLVMFFVFWYICMCRAVNMWLINLQGKWILFYCPDKPSFEKLWKKKKIQLISPPRPPCPNTHTHIQKKKKKKKKKNPWHSYIP